LDALDAIGATGAAGAADANRAARACVALAVLLAGASAFAPGCSHPEAAHGRPNVLLISIDTLRADHVHTLGYARETTPNIDRLAAEGVACERCWTTTSWTLPAHLSMLTGLDVSAHGVCDDRLWDVVGTPQGPKELPLC